MYIQSFILVKAVFFLEGIRQSSLIIKNPNKQSKTILMRLTENLVIIANSLWTRYKIEKNYVWMFALT